MSAAKKSLSNRPGTNLASELQAAAEAAQRLAALGVMANDDEDGNGLDQGYDEEFDPHEVDMDESRQLKELSFVGGSFEPPEFIRKILAGKYRGGGVFSRGASVELSSDPIFSQAFDLQGPGEGVGSSINMGSLQGSRAISRKEGEEDENLEFGGQESDNNLVLSDGTVPATGVQRVISVDRAASADSADQWYNQSDQTAQDQAEAHGWIVPSDQPGPEDGLQNFDQVDSGGKNSLRIPGRALSISKSDQSVTGSFVSDRSTERTLKELIPGLQGMVYYTLIF